jgi:hypothetical protein
MGQAKLRGSFEKRKKEAIKRNKDIMEARRIAELKRLNNMTPQELKEEDERNERLAQFMELSYNYIKPFNDIFR